MHYKSPATLAANNSPPPTEGENLFLSEQVNMVYKLLPFLLLSDLVTGTFLLLIVEFAVGLGPLGPHWFSILITSTLLRAIIRHNHLRHPIQPENLEGRQLFLISGALFVGLLWGTAWLLLPPKPSFIQVALIGFWLGGLQAGAAATMTIMKPVFWAYTIPANSLYLGFVATTEIDFLGLTIAAYIMYLGFIIPIAMRISHEVNETIKLKIQNHSLQEKLSREEKVLAEKEQELMIQKRKGAALESQNNSSLKKLEIAAEERILLMDSVEEGIFGLNRFGEITFINSSARELLQLGESEALGRSAIEILNSALKPSDKERKINLMIGSCYLGNKTLQKIDSIFCGNNDIRLPVRFSCRPVIKENLVIGAVVSFSNTTKQREMEAMLLQSQKMEAIGRLTGGVSHDFNNLLTIIMGNIQFLIKRLPGNTEAIQLLKRIMVAAKNGAELNHRLLSFSREQSLEEVFVDANDVISEMSDFLVRVLGEDITLKLQLSDKSCGLKIDRTQLENALLNLCVNARDAMPNGGTLKIETQLNPELPYQIKEGNGEPPEEVVMISVTDSGIGISPEHLKQIFEPFFTTKKKDRGTGLGLSTAYGFISQSGGNITASSRLGEWTTFRIWLPKAEYEETSTQLDPIDEDLGDSLSGLILVVEDDEYVRKVAVSMFTDAGFDVLYAANATEGWQQFEFNPDIDLVFSDVIMPGGMNGIQLAEKILDASPGMPIVLVTGYTDKQTRDEIPEADNVVCISKPYDTNEIPKLVYKMLKEVKSYE